MSNSCEKYITPREVSINRAFINWIRHRLDLEPIKDYESRTEANRRKREQERSP